MYNVLRSKLHGKVLDAAEGKAKEGTKIIMFPQNEPLSDNQRWTLDPEPGFKDGQYFRILSAMNQNLVLDVPASKGEPGVKPVIWTRNHPATPNQLWRWEGDAIVTALDPSLVLDIKEGNQDDKAEIILWQNEGNPNQKWKLEQVVDLFQRGFS